MFKPYKSRPKVSWSNIYLFEGRKNKYYAIEKQKENEISSLKNLTIIHAIAMSTEEMNYSSLYET